MPATCRIIDPHIIPLKERKPGDMWFYPGVREFYPTQLLSKKYNQQERPPLYVLLPNGAVFCVDYHYDHDGWDVTGQAPAITVSPSINFQSNAVYDGYHGYLTDGILTDDLEGRVYRL